MILGTPVLASNADADVIQVSLPKDVNGAVEDIKDVVDDNADDDADAEEKEEGSDMGGNMDKADEETGAGGGASCVSFERHAIAPGRRNPAVMHTCITG